VTSSRLPQRATCARAPSAAVGSNAAAAAREFSRGADVSANRREVVSWVKAPPATRRILRLTLAGFRGYARTIQGNQERKQSNHVETEPGWTEPTLYP